MIKIETHLHSNYSRDSRLSFDAIVKGCRAKGIDVVCITDHQTLDGALAFKEKTGFPTVIGTEIKTAQGEIIGYFLKKNIASNMAIEDTIQAIKEQNGIVCVPHPFDTYRRSRLKEGILDKIVNMVDLIEIFNSRNLSKKADMQAEEYCIKHGKIPIVGSDAHSVGEIGKAYMILNNGFSGPESFLEQIRSATYKTRKSFFHVHLITKWEKLKKPEKKSCAK